MNDSVTIYPEGRRLFAERIARNTEQCINGMYLEYSDNPDVDMTGRDLAFYDMLGNQAHSGYGRISVQDIYVREDGGIRITGLFSSADLRGGRISKDVKITAVTLAYLAGNSNDVFLATVRLDTPVRPVKGAAMSMTVTLNLE